MRTVLTLLSFLVSITVHAAEGPQHGFSDEAKQFMAKQNENLARFEISSPSVFADANNPLSFDLIEKNQCAALC